VEVLGSESGLTIIVIIVVLFFAGGAFDGILSSNDLI
jgi:hypothetical protein